jgi:hypothetical protein
MLWRHADRDHGTLIEAWASQKSFQGKDGGPDDEGRNFHGQTRKNETHASKTDMCSSSSPAYIT